MGVPDPRDNPDKIRKDFPPGDCRPGERFVAFCDVLGFRRLLEREPVGKIAESYDAMLREAEASCLMVRTYPSPTASIPKRYRAGSAVFSDTILLWSEPTRSDDNKSVDDSNSFIPYVASVFGVALKMGFPLRIGIAYGECVIDPSNDLYLGVPIIHSYEAEQMQDWVGIACHASCFNSPQSKNLCLELKDGWQLGPLIEYDIPLKPEFRDQASLKYSIDWPFWGNSDWGGRGDLEDILRDKVDQYKATQFSSRWQRALKYYEFRRSKWKSIEEKIRDKFPEQNTA